MIALQGELFRPTHCLQNYFWNGHQSSLATCWLITRLSVSTAFMERLSDIVDQPSEFQVTTEDGSQIALPPIRGEVVFENVSFSFKKDPSRLQLNNVSLEVPAGSFVGIVGKSGSGKSTLMKLLPRLYEPLKGKILLTLTMFRRLI